MIFISYQRESKEFALNLRSRLHRAGIPTFMDEDIEVGEEWKVVIDNALDQSVAVVVVVTFAALRSPYVTYEWSYAIGQRKRVVPIILEMPNPAKRSHPKLHPKINDRQYSDFTKASQDQWAEFIDEVSRIEHNDYIPSDVAEAEKAAKGFNRTDQRIAIQTLQDYDDEEGTASNALARLVQSRRIDVSKIAAVALAEKSKYRDERAISGLRHGINGSLDELNNAVRCLAQMATEGAVDCIVNALEDTRPNDTLRLDRLIQHGLCRIRLRAATEALIEIRETVGKNNIAVLDALGESRDPIALPTLINWRKELSANPQAYEAHQRAIWAIAKIPGAEAISELVSVLKENANYDNFYNTTAFKTALDELTKIGGTHVIEFLREEIKQRPLARLSQIIQPAIAEMSRKLNAK